MNPSRNYAGVLALCVGVLAGANCLSQSLQTLLSFAQPPSNPSGGLVQGPDGNFYGTAQYGGAYGYGSVFRVTTNGVMTDLVDFNGVNGAYPVAGLISDTNGSFYGTTQYGGTSVYGSGYGTVFRVTTNGVLTNLTGLNPRIGANPQANLVWGSDGKLYGTTCNGGDYGDGTVLQITTNGLCSALCSFAYTNGAHPVSSVLLSRDGNIYGTTQMGGNGFGVVYCLTPSGTLSTLGSFDFLFNGAFPLSALVEDAAGNLYGTASVGGGAGTGSGTIFEIPATNHQLIVGVAALNDTPHSGLVAGPGKVYYGATFNSLYQFSATDGSVKVFNVAIGGFSIYSAPFLGADGSLYDTTFWGGTNGYGTAFKFNTNGTLTTLFAFSVSSGAQPLGGVVQDAAGTLYGTAYNAGPGQNGTIFSLKTNGVVTNIVVFNSANGAYPCAGLLLGSNGLLYTTASLGGGGNGSAGGSVVRVATNGLNFTNLVSFYSTNGSYPVGGVISDSSGNLYGTTVHGGFYDYGTVFKLDPSGVLTTLAIFNNTNGATPQCTPVLDNAGYLWGTTMSGSGTALYGTIFRVPTNSPPNSLIAPFAVFAASNGSVPMAGLSLGPDGAFYGTAKYGGKHNYGVVYRVTTNGVITALSSFSGGNGAYPVAALIPGPNDVFYGTTSGFNGNEYIGDGTVFRVTTNGALNTFMIFNGTNGSTPSGPLLLGKDGALYGTTQYGGAFGSGTVFKLSLGPISPITLHIQLGSPKPVLTWTNPVFNLQAAPALTGPFTDVPEAFSPYTNSFTNRAMFFRLVSPGSGG
jgi:uncharacterized repeat protein (TIGR03803 family)